MSNLVEQIQEVLAKDSLEHTLSRESLKRMLDDLNDKDLQIESLTSTRKYYEDRCRELESKKAELQSKVASFESKRDDVENREKSVKDAELSQMRDKMALAYEQVRVGDHKEVLTSLLRNRVVSNSILETVPVPVAGYSGSSDQYGNQTPGCSGYVSKEEKTTDTKTEDK